MERGRKNIQTGLQKENEDVRSTGRERGAVWSRGMGLEHGRRTGQSSKEICEMDIGLRYDNTKLYTDRGMQINRNERKALKSAARYEEKALESQKELVKERIKERERERGNGLEGKRARKRKKGLEEVRKEGTQIETGEEQERMTADQIIEERRKREAEEKGERTRESKYNIRYRNIAKEKLPKYLEGRMKWKDRRILARFRCGNETKAREYWKEEGRKRCRLCRRKEEDLRRVIEECEITGGSKDIGKTLNETGEGLAEPKAIIEKRRANDKEEAQQRG
uniref:splicing regulatory glutamine/lysine-rich protein 1-like n=1 Tax=Bombus vancouverensis nearcticus TaxID=2705178 RepID=UPI001439BAE9|nr:splicing regulatory glutamine/lysine-rich protein 1-like [Bombus vancouverensis nearcticus]